MITAILAAMAVFILYQFVYSRFVAPPPPAGVPGGAAKNSPPGGAAAPDGAANLTERGSAAPAPATATTPATSTTPASAPAGGLASFAFSAGPSATSIRIGGEAGDALGVDLSPVGASLERLLLTKRNKDRYLHRESADGNDPLVLLSPVEADGRVLRSYGTPQIGLIIGDERAWDIPDLIWSVAERTSQAVTFETILRGAEDAALLRVTKRYALVAGTSTINLTLAAENLSGGELKFAIRQDGPLGVVLDDQYTRVRRVVIARRAAEGGLAFESALQASDVAKSDRHFVNGNQPLLWSALVSKYYGVFTRPLGPEGKPADFLASARAALAVSPATGRQGEVMLSFDTRTESLAPGATRAISFELYAGAKDEDELRAASPAYLDRNQLGYVAVHDFDSTCFCSLCNLPWLTRLLTGLLEFIRNIVGNFGVAIIIMVIIIRSLLHPLSVFQQKSMYRTQEAMARLHPKLELIKQRNANDKVKLNQETMKLYGEEGVNPAAPLLGMLPMIIQMPILISLWTALSNDIHLRHAPLDGWWIRDLSAPDGLFRFGDGGVTIPILGWLPLIGPFFSNIHSFNMLPILMGISMYLQQKYMPKPALAAKLEAAKQAGAATPAPPPGPRSGMSPEDQARQQQMIAHMMTIMMPIMFYTMPSGLNLYWMVTNVFGIVESLIIRRQMQAEKVRRAAEGPPPPPKPGRISEWFRRLSAEYQELQKKADEASGRKPKRGDRPKN